MCFAVPAPMADEAAGILVAAGALGCAVKAAFTPHPRQSGTVALEAFFEHLTRARLARLESVLGAAGMLASAAPVAERIVDPGWATQWMRRFRPLPVGRRLLIVPPWSDANVPGRLRLVLEPGQAFGTGHHPTTRAMLVALDSHTARRHFLTGLDVGTGSGVLALAMKLLGIDRVTAIDNDALALENARRNAALNGLTGRVRFSSAALAAFRKPFQLIAANILGPTLIELAPELKALLASDGRLLLSGILDREVSSLMAHYRPECRCVCSRSERGWTTLVLAR